MIKVALFFAFFIISPQFILAIKPERHYKTTPKDFGLKYTEAQIITKDGFYLNVWNIPAQNTKNITLIICGGDAGNMSYYLNQAYALTKKGINVILFDYRGFGKSSHFNIDTTLLFHTEFLTDFETVLNYARKIYPKNKIGTLGYSMGGYFPFMTNKKLDFILADSPLACPKNVLARLNKKNIKLPMNAPDVTFKGIKTLIFIGGKDNIIKMADFNNPKTDNIQLVPYKGGHCEAFEMDNNDFLTRIFEFINSI